MIIEATAITSADPVDMTAIRIKNSIAYSPVEPSNFWATNGAAKPTMLVFMSHGRVCVYWIEEALTEYYVLLI